MKKNNYGVLVAFSAVIALGSVAPSMAQNSRSQSGIASVYSTESGNKTASGQRLNPGALTAAHKSLPFGTKVKVTNKKNGRSVVVTINDRGPFTKGRIIDLTPAAAQKIGMGYELAPVTLSAM